MTIPEEEIACSSNSPSGSYIAYQTAMTCFTELRLSVAAEHARKYGALGLVVDRQWVLDRWGAPVHYVRSNLDEAIVGNMKATMDWLKRQKSPEATRVYENVLHTVAFMKGMSRPRKDDFAYLDENEWRIVHTFDQVTKGQLVATGTALPTHKIPLVPTDVRMVIFPDDACRDMACRDVSVTRWLAGHHVPFVTALEAAQF
ncbi:MAG TPA: abortive infection system antitoxin AbiGi family protein [Polyangiaceae bacterium]|nr:abortive infection system antitoxin AbiGi family protein [Polyangiaceae bacterium]